MIVTAPVNTQAELKQDKISYLVTITGATANLKYFQDIRIDNTRILTMAQQDGSNRFKVLLVDYCQKLESKVQAVIASFESLVREEKFEPNKNNQNKPQRNRSTRLSKLNNNNSKSKLGGAGNKSAWFERGIRENKKRTKQQDPIQFDSSPGLSSKLLS